MYTTGMMVRWICHGMKMMPDWNLCDGLVIAGERITWTYLPPKRNKSHLFVRPPLSKAGRGNAKRMSAEFCIFIGIVNR